MIATRTWFAAAIGLGLLAFGATGCTSAQYRREPFTTAQIIQMSKEKVPADEIIHRIRLSHTVYPLTAIDVKNLLDQGVDPKVVDEMMQTRVREAEQNCATYYPYPYSPYDDGPYYGLYLSPDFDHARFHGFDRDRDLDRDRGAADQDRGAAPRAER